MTPLVAPGLLQGLEPSSGHLTVVSDGKLEHVTLPLFGCKRQQDTSCLVAFVGGAVSCLEWCPFVSGVFAVAVRPSHQSANRTSDSRRAFGYIQFWRINHGGESASCLAVIEEDASSVVTLKWSPRRLEHPSSCLLACVLCDGSVRVYICNVKQLMTEDTERGSQVRIDCPFLTLEQPQMKDNLNTDRGKQYGINRVAWNTDGLSLATGSVTGEITFYQVGVSLSEHVEDVVSDLDGYQRRIFDKRWCAKCHGGAITGLEWLSSKILASVGADGFILVRDVREPNVALERIYEPYAWPTAIAKLSNSGGDLVAVYDTGLVRFVRLRGKARDPCQVRPETSTITNVRLQTGSIRCVSVFRSLTNAKEQACDGNALDKWSYSVSVYVAGSEGVVHKIRLIHSPAMLVSGKVRLGKRSVKHILQWRTPGNSNMRFCHKRYVNRKKLCEDAIPEEEEGETVANNCDFNTFTSEGRLTEGSISDSAARDSVVLDIPVEYVYKDGRKNAVEVAIPPWNSPCDNKYHVGAEYERNLVTTSVAVDEKSELVACGMAAGYIVICSVLAPIRCRSLWPGEEYDGSQSDAAPENKSSSKPDMLDTGDLDEKCAVVSAHAAGESGFRGKRRKCVKNGAPNAVVVKRRRSDQTAKNVARDRLRIENERRKEEARKRNEEKLRLLDMALEERRKKALEMRGKLPRPPIPALHRARSTARDTEVTALESSDEVDVAAEKSTDDQS